MTAIEKLRYAILWDLDDGLDAMPCGFLIDRGDYVWFRCVDVNIGWGMKERYDEPIAEMQPDCSIVTLTPADSGYFDHLLNTFHRMFAITFPPVVEEATT